MYLYMCVWEGDWSRSLMWRFFGYKLRLVARTGRGISMWNLPQEAIWLAGQDSCFQESNFRYHEVFLPSISGDRLCTTGTMTKENNENENSTWQREEKQEQRAEYTTAIKFPSYHQLLTAICGSFRGVELLDRPHRSSWWIAWVAGCVRSNISIW